MKYEPCMSGWFGLVYLGPEHFFNKNCVCKYYTIFCLDEFNINYEQAKILPNIAAHNFILGTKPTS